MAVPHRRVIDLLFVALIALVVAFAGTDASAQDRANLSVDVIIAGHDGAGVDPALAAHSGRLETQFSQFNSFRRADSSSFQLAPGATHQISIPGGQTVRFSLVSSRSGRYRITVQVPGGETTVESPAGGIFFVGGPRAPDGTIILLVRTR